MRWGGVPLPSPVVVAPTGKEAGEGWGMEQSWRHSFGCWLCGCWGAHACRLPSSPQQAPASGWGGARIVRAPPAAVAPSQRERACAPETFVRAGRRNTARESARFDFSRRGGVRPRARLCLQSICARHAAAAGQSGPLPARAYDLLAGVSPVLLLVRPHAMRSLGLRQAAAERCWFAVVPAMAAVCRRLVYYVLASR